MKLKQRAQTLLKQDQEKEDNATSLEMERLLRYFSNLINGQIHEKKQCYLSAILFYQLAEQDLIHITDGAERAEFFKQMVNIYQSLGQSEDARNYQEKYENELLGNIDL